MTAAASDLGVLKSISAAERATLIRINGTVRDDCEYYSIMRQLFQPRRREPLKRTLLAAGIASSLLYTAMNIFIPLRWSQYDWISQTVSELSAIGSPTRLVWMLGATIYVICVAGFGVGIRMAANQNRKLKHLGSIFLAYGVVCLFWPSMHQRAVLAAGQGTLTDTLHLVWAGMSILIMLAAMMVGASSLTRRFRNYSIVTIAVMTGFGILTSLSADRVAQDLPTPMIGLWERISIGAFLLWVVVLAAGLLKVRYAMNAMQR